MIIKTTDLFEREKPFSKEKWINKDQLSRVTFSALKKIYKKSGPHVLDYGCGNLMNSIALFENASITGLDLDEEALAVAEKNATYNNVNHSLMHASKLDSLGNESFDIANSMGVIEFMSEDVFKNVFEKIYKVLKKDGVLYVTFYNWRPFSALYLPYTKNSGWSSEKSYELYSKIIGIRISQKSILQVEDEFKKIGFTVIESGGVNPYPAKFWKFIFSSILFKTQNKKIAYWYCTQYIVLKK